MGQATPITETEPGADAVQIKWRFAAPPEAVFDAWIRPEALKAWFGPGEVTTPVAEIDPRPGGRYLLEMHGPTGGVYRIEGEYVTVERPDRLVFTWFWRAGDTGQLADHEMLVTVELRPLEGGTELTLTHERMPSAEQAENHRGGWTSGLDNLERYLSAG